MEKMLASLELTNNLENIASELEEKLLLDSPIKYHPLVECQYQQIDCVGVEKNFEQFHGILIRRKSPDSGFDSFYENKPIYIQSTSIQETVLNGANEFLRQEAFGRHLKSLANRKVLKNISLSRTVVHREQLDKILKNGCPTVIGHKHSIIERKIYHRELMTLCDLLSDLKNQRHQMEYILMVFRTNTDPVSLAKLNKLKPDTQDVILIGNLIVKEITQVEILMDILDSKYEMMDRTGCTAAIKTVMESVDHFRKFRSRCINTAEIMAEMLQTIKGMQMNINIITTHLWTVRIILNGH